MYRDYGRETEIRRPKKIQLIYKVSVPTHLCVISGLASMMSLCREAASGIHDMTGNSRQRSRSTDSDDLMVLCTTS